MVDNEMITALLNSYRGEIMAKSPKSLSTWQANRTVMPAGVGQPVPVGGSLSNGD